MKKLTPILMITLLLLSILPFSAFGATFSVEESLSEFQLENVPKLSSSVNISIPNIDFSLIHDPNPLEPEQIDLLKQNGFSSEQILSMDAGDFAEIEKT